MASGTLKVVLVSARGLKAGDLFGKTDAYALLTYSTQTRKSNTATNQGANPVWNQEFTFTVEEGISELTLKIMDEDMFTADDHLGSVKIPLHRVLRDGQIPPTPFSVVKPDGYFQGEVKVSMTFIPKENQNCYLPGAYPPTDYLAGPRAYSPADYSGGSYGSSHLGGLYGSGHSGGWNS